MKNMPDEESESIWEKPVTWFFRGIICIIAFECIHFLHNSWDHTLIVNEVLKTNSVNKTVSVTPEVEPAVILKPPPVQVSEYPKVEPELPREFMGPAITITNESQMLNEIQVQDQLLLWLNQLDK